MKIIVAIDPFDSSQADSSGDVLSEILARPWPEGARFEVVTVADTAHLPGAESLRQELQAQAAEICRRGALRLAAEGLHASACPQVGDPKTVLPAYASEGAADWIFAGSHAGLLDEYLLGGVAKTLIRHGPCPVEIVRPSGWRKDDRPGKRILLATDGSQASGLAVASIAERPWPAGTEVRILSAVELEISALQAFEPPGIHSQALEEMRVQAMLRAQDAVTRARESLASTGLEVSESLSVLLEKPAKIILDEAREWGADLIAVGSHGRRGWQRFWLGSVSEAVATHAHCSVEVIRPRHPLQS